MEKKKKKNNHQKSKEKPILSQKLQKIASIFSLFFFSFLFLFSLLNKAGIVGKVFSFLLNFLFGKAAFLVPLLLFLSALLILKTRYEKIAFPLFLANFLFLVSGSVLIESFLPKRGGIFGKVAYFFFKLFGPLITEIIFLVFAFFALFLFWYLVKEEKEKEETKETVPLIKRIFLPKFKVEKIESSLPKVSLPEEKKEEKIKKEKAFTPLASEGYVFPPLNLLEKDTGQAFAGDIQQNSLIIKKTLEHFGIPVEMGEVNIGPTVTQYTFKPAEGIKLSKITALSNDLALALAAHPVRIEAPIPGKSLVGVEVPNKKRVIVRLRDLLAEPSFQTISSSLAFPLGRDVSGTPIFVDLARMPHLLVAGATGTGKTIFLNNLIISLLYRNSPKTLRLILIDPKRVEFHFYNDLCHLLAPVIFYPQKAVVALEWLIGEMERRFDVLAEEKTKDIDSFNQKVSQSKEKEPLPYIVVIIDELADLMVAKGKEIETKIVRLAQLARAVGIHLVVATQRPSVEVITGLIKANITCRVSFQVASQVDSRTVLDVAGAEKLLGSGDLLYLSPQSPKPKRAQAPYISEKEIRRVTSFIKTKNPSFVPFENGLSQELQAALSAPEEGKEVFFEGKEDPLFEEAKRVVIEAQRASASLLQRKLSIGYARAARLLDILEERGIIGPAKGAKPREVYIKKEEEENWQKV